MRFSPCSTHLHGVAPGLHPPGGQELSPCPQITMGQRRGLSEAGVCNPSLETLWKRVWKHRSHVLSRVGNSPPVPAHFHPKPRPASSSEVILGSPAAPENNCSLCSPGSEEGDEVVQLKHRDGLAAGCLLPTPHSISWALFFFPAPGLPGSVLGRVLLYWACKVLGLDPPQLVPSPNLALGARCMGARARAVLSCSCRGIALSSCCPCVAEGCSLSRQRAAASEPGSVLQLIQGFSSAVQG